MSWGVVGCVPTTIIKIGVTSHHDQQVNIQLWTNCIACTGMDNHVPYLTWTNSMCGGEFYVASQDAKRASIVRVNHGTGGTLIWQAKLRTFENKVVVILEVTAGQGILFPQCRRLWCLFVLSRNSQNCLHDITHKLLDCIQPHRYKCWI